MRAAEHCPISILQAHGGGAIPRLALWTTERFVRFSSAPAVELPPIALLAREHIGITRYGKCIVGLNLEERPSTSLFECVAAMERVLDRSQTPLPSPADLHAILCGLPLLWLEAGQRFESGE